MTSSIRRTLMLLVGLGILYSLISSPAHAQITRNEPVCVISAKANLRAEPSPSARITWIVGRNMPLERISTMNGWSQVKDLRGHVHWVISKNVSPEESCAVVRVRTAALHIGPKQGDARADFKVADRYTPFKKVDREGMWVRIEDDYKGSYWTKDSNMWIPVKRTRMSF